MVVYAGPGGNADTHSHHAIQLATSFDSPFDLELADRTTTCSAILIPSGVSHGFRSSSEQVLIALIEPLGTDGAALDQAAIDAGLDCLDWLPEPTAAQADVPESMIENVLRSLLPGNSFQAQPSPSPHVQAALSYLDEAIAGKPRLEEAASVAAISPSRLTHLFTQEVGIPFRKFVLWLRLRHVVDELSLGRNLTECAHAAGFSDSAHLSRVFRDHFGLPPSALLGMRVSPDAWPS